ncbi:MAG: TIGR03032 family protein [Bacteroidota bacterium]
MSTTKQFAPFSCNYTPQFAQLLHNLGISLIISTYQAGKVVVLSPVEEDKLIQLPRSYKSAMGLATEGNHRIAIAGLSEVTVLQNSGALAKGYPQKKGVYDGMYFPRATYYTGNLFLHDMAFSGDKLIAVNTLFSCLSYIDDKYSFTPFWKPDFISELAAEDRCHLNGMALENNEVRYVTALGNNDTAQGWRDNKMQGGILMDVPSGEILLEGLGMPHSPRIYNGKLYLLNSTQGELICVDIEKKNYEVVCKLGGYARGMDRFGDYLFIGVSKLRHNSPVFRDLPIAETSYSGVIAVHLPYGSIAGHIKYEVSVDEIYDVKVLPGLKRPSVLSPEMPVHKRALHIPETTFWSAGEEKENQSPVMD